MPTHKTARRPRARRNVRQPEESLEQPGLLTVQDVAQILRVGTRTVWRQVATGVLPRPVAVTSRLRRWKRTDIERHISNLRAPDGPS